MKKKPIFVEMFLDRTDMSKIVDKHGTERYQALSHSPKLVTAFIVEKAPVLTKKGLKTVKIGLNR